MEAYINFEIKINDMIQNFTTLKNDYAILLNEILYWRNENERLLTQLAELQEVHEQLQEEHQTLSEMNVEDLSRQFLEFMTKQIKPPKMLTVAEQLRLLPVPSPVNRVLPVPSPVRVPTPKLVILPNILPNIRPNTSTVVPPKVNAIVKEAKRSRGRPPKEKKEFSQDPVHLPDLAEGDYTLGRITVTNEWVEGKDDFFIAKRVANLYNNLSGKTDNNVVNVDNAINNFILGYNHLNSTKTMGFVWDSAHGRIIAHPANMANAKYKEVDVNKLGLKYNSEGFVEWITEK